MALDEQMIRSIAKNVGVPEGLALAVWEQESGRGKNTRQHATAKYGMVRGPFQVTDATFKQFNPGGDVNDDFDNAVAGIKYLKHWWDRTGGDVEATAQAYHSGSPGDSYTDKNGILRFKKDSLGKYTNVYGKDIVSKVERLGLDNPANYDSKDYKAKAVSLFGLDDNIPPPIKRDPVTIDNGFSEPLADPHKYIASQEMRDLLSKYYDDVMSEMA